MKKEMNQIVSEVVSSVESIMKEKNKKVSKWAVATADILIRIARAVKTVEEWKEAGTRVLKIKYDMEKKPFNTVLEALKGKDKALREALLRNSDFTTSIVTDNGEVVARLIKSYKIIDVNLLPEKYKKLVADDDEIKRAMKEGIASIPGVEMLSVRGIAVYPAKSATSPNSEA